ncbi:MAG TPA: M13 family metallopeptidase [Candidatus Eisenbacteria bacterium]|nr:M13 family metallopeptidase [Candidatus Eisenbacteria bacterium]
MLCLALLAVTALSAPAPTAAEPLIKPWGLRLEYIDKSVKPGDDFYSYANGLWLKTAEIAPDRGSAGAWTDSNIRAEERLKAIIAELHTRKDLTAEEKKLRDLYDAFTDEARIEANGLKPIEKDLAAIAALKTHEDVARMMSLPALNLGGPFGIWIWRDDKNPDAYALRMVQSGLALPGRDYYLREDKELAAAREAYRKYLAETLVSVGVPEADAATRAAAIYEMEVSLAGAHWPAEDRRDADKVYNPMTIPELKAFAPDYPWEAMFASAGIPLKTRGGADRTVIVREKSAFPPIAKIFAATPVAVWRDYLTVRCVRSFAHYLPRRYEDADFAFFGKTLGGQTQQQDRATRGVRLLDRRMGEALGKIYVAKHFPPEAKKKIRALVDNLLVAFEQNLKTLEWMTPATRAKAEEKRKQFTVKVGYPDKWQDYSALVVRRDDLVASIKNCNTFDWRHEADRIDDPVDRSEWIMSPPTVNAYYEEAANEIVFPAGMLQPPHFDLEADDAVNYGAIGSIIGHEISHGFDDQGSKYDGTGRLVQWWTDEDRKKFEERTGVLVKQYEEYEPLPGLRLNGQLTLGENIGDLSGVAIAHKAYRLSLGGKEAPVRDGLTGDQRFYLAFAQSWRTKSRDEITRQRTLNNPHSAPEYRVIGVVRNHDAWYAAFPEVSEQDRYYLAPEKRVRIW